MSKPSLLSNLFNGLLSNVKQSLYLFDYTLLLEKPVRSAITAHNIKCLSESKLFSAGLVLSFSSETGSGQPHKFDSF